MKTPKKYHGLTVYRWLRTKLRACSSRAEAYKGKTLTTAGAFAVFQKKDTDIFNSHRNDLHWLENHVFSYAELHQRRFRMPIEQTLARAARRFHAWQRSEAAKRSRRRRVSR